jgi:hypothetical protein
VIYIHLSQSLPERNISDPDRIFIEGLPKSARAIGQLSADTLTQMAAHEKLPLPGRAKSKAARRIEVVMQRLAANIANVFFCSHSICTCISCAVSSQRRSKCTLKGELGIDM